MSIGEREREKRQEERREGKEGEEAGRGGREGERKKKKRKEKKRNLPKCLQHKGSQMVLAHTKCFLLKLLFI